MVFYTPLHIASRYIPIAITIKTAIPHTISPWWLFWFWVCLFIFISFFILNKYSNCKKRKIIYFPKVLLWKYLSVQGALIKIWDKILWNLNIFIVFEYWIFGLKNSIREEFSLKKVWKSKSLFDDFSVFKQEWLLWQYKTVSKVFWLLRRESIWLASKELSLQQKMPIKAEKEKIIKVNNNFFMRIIIQQKMINLQNLSDSKEEDL